MTSRLSLADDYKAAYVAVFNRIMDEEGVPEEERNRTIARLANATSRAIEWKRTLHRSEMSLVCKGDHGWWDR